MKVAVIHGPNLRLLGKREPEVYGSDTLDDVNASLRSLATELGAELETFQSNHEGELLDFIEAAAPAGRWLPDQSGRIYAHICSAARRTDGSRSPVRRMPPVEYGRS